MRAMRSALAWMIVLACASGATGNAAERHAAQPSSAAFRDNQVNRIIGKTVENEDGRKLGKVKNFIVDVRSGRILYGLVSSGGFLGVRPHLILVPALALSVSTAKRGTVSLDIKIDDWQHAPQFKKRDLPYLAEPGRVRQIYSYFGQRVAPQSGGQTNEGELPPTGQSRTGGLALALTSELTGTEVINEKAQTIGQFSDLLVDLSNRKPALAIITAGQPARRAGSFAVLLQMLRLNSHGKTLLDTHAQNLEQVPALDEHAWQMASSRGGIYRYEPPAADNTARNAAGVDSENLTAVNQSVSKEDIALAKKIRETIMRDKSLSMTAKNVKIIIVDGIVTLRGPVRREPERNAILKIARDIAGASNVVNELELIR